MKKGRPPKKTSGRRLNEAEEIFQALRNGEADALLVSTPQGDQVFTLKGADHSYRILVEEMSEGAAVLTREGDILYANARLAEILAQPLEKVIGFIAFTFFIFHFSFCIDSSSSFSIP